MNARRLPRARRASRAKAPRLPGGSAATRAAFAKAAVSFVTITLAAVALCAAAPAWALPLESNLPPGFEPPAVPADEPLTPERIALGRAVFTDPRLSFNGSASCASCHDPAQAFSDPRPASIGAGGEQLTLSAPSLINAGYRAAFGWAPGGSTSLSEQIRRPFTQREPVELATPRDWPAILARLDADAALRAAFAAAFDAPLDADVAAGDAVSAGVAVSGGSPVTFDRVVVALAAYLRTLVGGRSAFDRYVFAGEHTALTPEQKRGFTLFYSARLGCGTCHAGLLFDGPWVDARNPAAPAAVAASVTGDGSFRVPSLRNVARTAPYLHDGRDSTLGAVVNRYERVRGFTLDSAERAALLAFLAALSDAPVAAE